MTFQKLPRDNETERSFLLALYTEVTVTNVLKDTGSAISAEVGIATPLAYVHVHSAVQKR